MSARKQVIRRVKEVQTDEIISTARLLLELYGSDVVFASPEKIDRFLVDADLLDKPDWRRVLLVVGDSIPAVERRLCH